MGQLMRPHGGRFWPVSVGVVALLSLALKLYIAYATVGTNDVSAWARFANTANWVGGAELYRREALFNHPPFMVHVLQLLVILTRYTGVPFPFWLRLPAILADLVTVVLVWKILTPRPDQWGQLAALLLLAIAPPLLMISGFHGNTDPAMICFVVLAVYLLGRGSVVPAGVALGMALSIKVVPLIFIPVMVCYLSTWRARLAFCLAAAAVWGAGAMPYLLQAPELIMRQVFGYAGNYGQWGISRILTLRAARAHPGTPWSVLEHGPYSDIGRIVILVSIIAAAAWMNRPAARRPSLFVQCGLVIFLFLAFSPAFGVQYLAWLMPWVIVLGFRATLVLYTVSTLFLFQVYTLWAGGFPWYRANAYHYGWHGVIIVFDLLCWATVVAILVCYVASVWKTRQGLAHE